MARRVFFSFHYEDDVNRAMVVRNSDVTQGIEQAGFVDKAEFETVKRSGEQAVRRWIDKQLEGTSVTVILIGAETLNRPYVQYEICKSLERGNGIIGVKIQNIKDMKTLLTSTAGNVHTVIGHYDNNRPAYFDEIADAIYDYISDKGYENMGTWIENSAKKHGK